MGSPCSEARPQSRSKLASGGSNRSKAKKAAPKPAKQPDKQSVRRMPTEAPASHRDKAACIQQLPAYAELPSQTAAKHSNAQAPDDRDDNSSMEQPESSESQAVLQSAQPQKQKAARRKAAKNKGANLQTKISAYSGDLSATSFTGDTLPQKEPAAAARVPVAVEASAEPVAQPPRDEQTLHKLSPLKHPAPEPAPDLNQVLQQNTSETGQSTTRSSMSDQSDAALRGPCLPSTPTRQPTIARPAPVRLSKIALQHSRSSPANSRPPPLHVLLPASAPQPHHIQVWTFSEALAVPWICSSLVSSPRTCRCMQTCNPIIMRLQSLRG